MVGARPAMQEDERGCEGLPYRTQYNGTSVVVVIPDARGAGIGCGTGYLAVKSVSWVTARQVCAMSSAARSRSSREIISLGECI